MFYQLTHLDGNPLPVRIPWRTREYEVTGGGLLLEPPELNPYLMNPTEGTFILMLEGGPVGMARLPFAWFVMMTEGYRWVSADVLEVPMPGQDGAMCEATRNGSALELVVNEEGSGGLTGRSLRLVAAPETPIPNHWRDVLFSDGLLVGFSVPPTWWHKLIAAAMQLHHAAGRPARRRKARLRLEQAWTAPA